jgi:hypothetical protein
MGINPILKTWELVACLALRVEVNLLLSDANAAKGHDRRQR